MGLRLPKDGSSLIMFNGHIERVVSKLDQMYEFGPTSLFMFASDDQDAHAMFRGAINQLSILDLNRGLSRLERLNRKRVCPWPVEFVQICIADEADWHDLRGCFEQRTA